MPRSRRKGPRWSWPTPFSWAWTARAWSPLLRQLKDLGLDGIEVFYSEHSPSQVDLYLHLAAKLDLLITGGSDFHGRSKPDIQLGRGRGKLFVPRALLDRMKETPGGPGPAPGLLAVRAAHASPDKNEE